MQSSAIEVTPSRQTFEEAFNEARKLAKTSAQSVFLTWGAATLRIRSSSTFLGAVMRLGKLGGWDELPARADKATTLLVPE